MIRTYEIDLDDELVKKSTEVFDTLGIEIDTAIKAFLRQAVLKKGFPFDVKIPSVKGADPATSASKAPAGKSSAGDTGITGDVSVATASASPEKTLAAEAEDSAGTSQTEGDDDESEDEDETCPDNLFDRWGNDEKQD